MANYWQNLIDVLEKQLELYTDSLDISRMKKEVLISGNIDNLNALTKQEEAMIFTIGKLERQRQAVVKEIGKQHGLPMENLSMKAISQLVDPEFAPRLTAINAELVAVFQQMAPLHKLNKRLIKQALIFVNQNLNLLTQTASGPTYAQQGTMVEATAKTRFWVDRKI